MKRTIKFVIAGLVLVAFVVLVVVGFRTIEKESAPYYAKKSQFTQVFYENKALFEALAQYAKDYEENFTFQYDSNLGSEQPGQAFGVGAFADTLWEVIQSCGMTNIQKNDEGVIIYQYAPVIASDVQIGARYNYDTAEWSFYYQHDYENCRHGVPTVICRLYDFIYNNEGTL